MPNHRLLALITSRYSPIVVVIVLVVALATPGLVAAQEEDPDIEAFVAEPVLEPGTTSALTLQLVNEAPDADEEVGPARNVRATLRANGTPLTVRSGTRALGDLPADGVREASYQVSVPETIESGTYDLTVEVRYDHGEDERTTTNLTATVRIEDRARFAVVGSDSNVSIGGTGTIALDVENVGSEAARDASVTLESANGVVGFDGASTASRFAGEWAVGETKTVVFDASVAETAETRRYPLRASVSYDTPDGIPGTSRTLPVGVTPGPEQTFVVRKANSTLAVGGEGSITGTIENEGPDVARNAVVVLQSENPAVEPLETEYAVGTLDPGERASFEFDARTADSASPGPRQFSVVLQYRDGDGDQRQSDALDVPARIGGEQTFDVTDVSSTLRVGEEGELRGELVNTADRPVRNAVVVFAPDSQTIHPVEREIAVGDLDPGERAPFAFDVDVSESAGAGERQFSIDVRYRDRNDAVRTSDPIDLRAAVEPQRERFGVDSLDANVTAGSDGTVRLRVTNRGDEPVSDVSAKLFASSPISTTDDEAFVLRLEPGETEELLFGVSAAGDANAKVYPLSIDFQYDTPDGDTELSETYRVPLTVREPTGNSVPSTIVLGIVAVVVLLALGAFLYRRL